MIQSGLDHHLGLQASLCSEDALSDLSYDIKGCRFHDDHLQLLAGMLRILLWSSKAPKFSKTLDTEVLGIILFLVRIQLDTCLDCLWPCCHDILTNLFNIMEEDLWGSIVRRYIFSCKIG